MIIHVKGLFIKLTGRSLKRRLKQNSILTGMKLRIPGDPKDILLYKWSQETKSLYIAKGTSFSAFLHQQPA